MNVRKQLKRQREKNGANGAKNTRTVSIVRNRTGFHSANTAWRKVKKEIIYLTSFQTLVVNLGIVVNKKYHNYIQ